MEAPLYTYIVGRCRCRIFATLLTDVICKAGVRLSSPLQAKRVSSTLCHKMFKLFEDEPGNFEEV